MWILTSFGAFMPALRPPDTVAEGDDQTLQVRARRPIDLDRLREHYMSDLGPTYAIKDTDYQFRAHCTPAALAKAVALVALDIDYVKFKPTTSDVWGDDQLHHAYLGVWHVLAETLSPGRRRPRRPPARREVYGP
jgi:hypothetical protein